FVLDHVPDSPGFLQPLLPGPLKAGWVRKTPMQSLRDAGKDGTPLRTGLVANRNDVSKGSPRVDEVHDAFGLILGQVDAEFVHGRHGERVELARFDAGAVGFKLFAAQTLKKRLGHLAAGAVVNADIEN